MYIAILHLWLVLWVYNVFIYVATLCLYTSIPRRMMVKLSSSTNQITAWQGTAPRSIYLSVYLSLSLYIYIYVYIHIHIHLHIHLHLHIHIHITIYIYIYIYIHGTAQTPAWGGQPLAQLRERRMRAPRPCARALADVRPISLLRLSLLRLLDSNFPGNPLRAWEFHPLNLRFCLSQALNLSTEICRTRVSVRVRSDAGAPWDNSLYYTEITLLSSYFKPC